MSDKTLCQHLAEYTVSLQPQALPQEVVERAKAIVLHNLAITFGGVGTDQMNKAVDLIESRQGAATLVGHSFKASPIEAALTNSVGLRALRMEDMVIPSMAHPGACVVPAALALAEQNDSSGAELVAAVTIGYEIIGKVAGTAYTWSTSNRTPSHIYNALGVAATAARLMRLDVEQTTGALAHACNLGALITEGIQDFQYGLITHNGMFAAQLGKVRAPFPLNAIEGPVGLYAVQLNGKHPTTREEILGRLSNPYEIMSAVLKPHPCTGSNLVPIAILRREMREHGLKAEDITSIKIFRASSHGLVIGHHSYGPFVGYMNGMYEATSSLPFSIAAVMVDGEIKPDHFSNANDPRIAAVIRRLEVEFVDGMGLLDHKMIIKTRDGRTIEAKGGREMLPVPNSAAILEKYALPIVGAQKIQELQRQIAGLEKAPSVHPLAQCLA